MQKLDCSSTSRFFCSTPGLLLLALTAIACLRFSGAASNDLWQDEIVCIYKARGSFARTVEILRHENQPPLYHFVLKSWIGAFGDTPLSVRIPSILCGLLLQLLIFLCARKLFGLGVAWRALLISGCSVALLEFTQEATPYALFWLLCFFGSQQFIRVWRAPRSGLAWALYVLARGAALYTHYFAVFLLCAEGCWCLLHCRSRLKFFGGWLLALLAIASSFLPWLPVFLEQNRRVGAEFWVPPVTLSAIANAFRQWSLWIPERDHRPWIFFAAAICLLYAIVLLVAFGKIVRAYFSPADAAQSSARDNSALLCFYLIVPILAVVAFSLRRSLFTPKYLLICVPYYYLLAAYGISALRPNWLGHLSGGLIVGGSFFFCLMNQTQPGYLNPQFADAARLIRADWRQDDLLLARDSQSFVALDYHLRDLRAAVYWWLPPEDDVPFWQGLKGYPEQRFINDAKTALDKHRDGARQTRARVWLILPIPNYKYWEKNYLQEPRPKPDPPELKQRGYERARYQYFAGVEIYLYEPREPGAVPAAAGSPLN